MKAFLPGVLILSLLWVAPTAREQAPPASPTAIAWQTLQHPTFSPDKMAMVSNLRIVRDRIQILLTAGTIEFAGPANGRVFAAAFRGSGALQMTPPNPLEAQQLRLFLNKDAIDLHFSDATFVFTDQTYEEIAAQVQWTTASPTGAGDLAKLYAERQQQREEMGFDLKRKLLRSLFAKDRERTAFFSADLKTSEKGWMTVRYDGLDAEEIGVEHWVSTSYGRDTDSWMSFPAGGRSSSEAYADPFAKEDFHIQGYVIDARVTSGAELSAVTKVRAESRLEGERVWIFELNSNLRIEKITDEKGRALEFYQSRERKDRNVSYGEVVSIVFPEPTQKNEVKTLEFRYAGKRVVRQEGAGNYFCPSEGWYPFRGDSFNSRVDFDITFHSPKKFTLVATGNKESETVDGNEKITAWKTDKPLAVAGFAYGDYKVITENAGNVFVDIYANREPDEVMESLERIAPAVGSLSPAILAKPMASEFANAVRVFENYFGAFPYKHLSVTSLPVSFTYGQGWPGLIYLWSASFLDDQQRHQLLRADPIEVTDFFRAHETSHMWWGHRVGWKSYHDQWMSEGFAQFSGNLYVQYRENIKEYVNRLRKDKEELKAPDLHSRPYESVGPVWMGERLSSSESPRAYQTVIYNKGGFILHMLRMMLYDPQNVNNPEQRFKEMMHDFCDTFDNKAASTEDFKAIVEKHMSRAMDLENNHRMDWFFRQYVYGTGIPKYEMHYDVQEAGNNQWKVSGALTRASDQENWKDMIPLYVHQGKETHRIGSLRATQQTSHFEFVLAYRPDKVSLNDNEDVLADIKQ